MKVAVISLSSGMLGESFLKHQLDIGVKRLNSFGLEVVFTSNALKGIDYIRDNPKSRALDLIEAFNDESIDIILCAIGGLDTYRTLPYLMENEDFIKKVKSSKKKFLGFSDSTINHLMFYKLGLMTYYGQAFLTEFGELEHKMLSYSEESFLSFLKDEFYFKSNDYWYEERKKFDSSEIGVKRVKHKEKNHYEFYNFKSKVKGHLIGGCLESLYEMISSDRDSYQKEICSKYNIFPSKEDLNKSILFLETSEEKREPNKYRQMILKLKEEGLFDNINALIVGKPQDEIYYDEYKDILLEEIKKPIVYNLNFGHALPRAILKYGALVEIDHLNETIHYID